MSTTTNITLKIATSGLTGRREADIAYLQEQILEYADDAQTVATLNSILRSLAFSGTTMVAA